MNPAGMTDLHLRFKNPAIHPAQRTADYLQMQQEQQQR